MKNLQDYFTRLPDTCLLEIFKHLTRYEIIVVILSMIEFSSRKDLDYLKGVNKKIHSVSNDKSLDRIKWEQGGLYICQVSNYSNCYWILFFFKSERGYSFEVRIRKDAKRNRFTSYQYEIYKSDDGYFIEERKLQYLSDFKVKLFEILSLKIFRSIHSK